VFSLSTLSCRFRSAECLIRACVTLLHRTHTRNDYESIRTSATTGALCDRARARATLMEDAGFHCERVFPRADKGQIAESRDCRVNESVRVPMTGTGYRSIRISLLRGIRHARTILLYLSSPTSRESGRGGRGNATLASLAIMRPATSLFARHRSGSVTSANAKTLV